MILLSLSHESTAVLSCYTQFASADGQLPAKIETADWTSEAQLSPCSATTEWLTPHFEFFKSHHAK